MKKFTKDELQRKEYQEIQDILLEVRGYFLSTQYNNKNDIIIDILKYQ